MRNLTIILSLMASVIFSSCEEDALDPQSIYSDAIISDSKFDKWLIDNYVEPYNIEFKYKFEDRESDLSYNLSPASLDKSVVMSVLVKYLWLDIYDQIVSPTFIKTYAPRMIHLVGSPAYNVNSNSIVLGSAEGGLKVTLYNVNYIDIVNLDPTILNYWYFKTMHHEFAHILHQTKNFSTDFNNITPEFYQSSSWVNVSQTEALKQGFVSSYATSETREDFVETYAVYVTNTPEYWADLMTQAGVSGAEKINQKLEMVKDYMLTVWSLDIDLLRDEVQLRSASLSEVEFPDFN